VATIGFGPWMPDQPDFNNPGITEALNVLPRTQESYGPLGALSATTDALTNRPQGAGAFRDSDGNVATFAADETDLFKLSGSSWGNVSSSAGAYTVAAEESVRFIQYGNRVMALLGLVDPIQSYVLGSSSAFATLAAAAPRARHGAVIRNHVMVGNTYDSGDGNVPNRVWWNAIDDPTSWPTIGSAAAAAAQSDYQDLPSGGWVQAIIGAIGGVDGAVFMEKAIYRVQYEGSPTIYGFYEVERDRGTPAPYSVVNVGSIAFYLAEDGFYAFNGTASQPIGAQRVDKTFFADLDQNYYHRIYGAADPINKMVFWIYPGTGNTGGRPNKGLVYNWELDRWSHFEQDADILFRDLTVSSTLEDLDAFGTMETLEFSLDSRVWTGGKLILSAFDSDKKLARFAGANLAATLDTMELGGGDRVMVTAVRPQSDSSNANMTVALRYRQTPGGALTTTSAASLDDDGKAHFRVNGRYMRGRLVIASGASWTHAQGVTADTAFGGAR